MLRWNSDGTPCVQKRVPENAAFRRQIAALRNRPCRTDDCRSCTGAGHCAELMYDIRLRARCLDADARSDCEDCPLRNVCAQPDSNRPGTYGLRFEADGDDVRARAADADADRLRWDAALAGETPGQYLAEILASTHGASNVSFERIIARTLEMMDAAEGLRLLGAITARIPELTREMRAQLCAEAHHVLAAACLLTERDTDDWLAEAARLPQGEDVWVQYPDLADYEPEDEWEKEWTDDAEYRYSPRDRARRTGPDDWDFSESQYA